MAAIGPFDFHESSQLQQVDWWSIDPWYALDVPAAIWEPFLPKAGKFFSSWPGCQAKRLRAGLGRVERWKQAQRPVLKWPAWTFPRWTGPNWRKPWRTWRIVSFYISDQTWNNFRIVLIPLDFKFLWKCSGRLLVQDASDQLSKIQRGSVRVKTEPKSPVSFLEPSTNKKQVYSHACVCTYVGAHFLQTLWGFQATRAFHIWCCYSACGFLLQWCWKGSARESIYLWFWLCKWMYDV